MSFAPLPDLAQNQALRRDISDLRARLDVAGEEVASGLRSDPTRAAGGDPARLFAIERGQAEAERRAEAVVVAQGRVSTIQQALGGLQDLADELGLELSAALGRGDLVAARLHAQGAEGALQDAVNTLNKSYAGRSLFAGAETRAAAVAPAEDILADVEAIVSAAPDVATALADIDAYFGPGGGFETVRYLGAAADGPQVSLDGGAVLPPGPRADDAAFRDLLKGLATAAVAADPAYAGPLDGAPDLLGAAASNAIQAREDVVFLRSELGLSEQRLEQAATRLSARRFALDRAWNDAFVRDPYEAASEFQALEAQLQSTFAVTARLASLSLSTFLR
ncbi:MAG: flagellin [Pseudomonadota bacterium]